MINLQKATGLTRQSMNPRKKWKKAAFLLISMKHLRNWIENTMDKYSVGVQGAIRLSPVILPVFCVILSQRTSSTPPSSAWKPGKILRAEVAESKMWWFAFVQGTWTTRTGRTWSESNAAGTQISHFWPYCPLVHRRYLPPSLSWLWTP